MKNTKQNATKINVTPTDVTVKRGRKPLPVKFPAGPFTVKGLFTLNAKATGGVMDCELTARNHIQRGLASGKLVKLDRKETTEKAGAPAFLFQLKSAYDYNQARRAKKVAPVTTETAPAPAAPVAETTVETV